MLLFHGNARVHHEPGGWRSAAALPVGLRPPSRAAAERARVARLYAFMAGALIVIALVAVWSMHRRSGRSPERSDAGQTYREGRALFDDARRARIEWVRKRLAARGAANPLPVSIPPRRAPGGGMIGPRELSVSMEGDTLVISADGEIRRCTLDQIDSRILAASAAAIAREDRAGNPPADELRPQN